MAPRHIISWEAAPTSAVRVDSFPSDLSLARAAPSKVRSMSLPLILGDNESGTQHADDDDFTRHHKYFFKDGNITFLINNTLYCVHRHFFSQHSTYFSTRFDKLKFRDHEALSIILSLEGVECKDFDVFLSIIYPDGFNGIDLCYKQWVSVLRLSTLWDFSSMRQLALTSINPPTSFDRLLLARTYSVVDWIVPALSALCERTEPLSLDEARQMSTKDIVLVTTIRENIRDDTLKVDSDDIPRRVRAARRKAKRKTDAEPAEGAAKEGEERTAKTAAAKRKADAEPAGRGADEDVRRTAGKAAKREVDVEVVKVKRAGEEDAGQR